MQENDSWQNLKQFSVLGIPILLDEPLIRGNNELPVQKKKVILALEENINLDKSALAIHEIEAVNIKAKISKLDRFENWVRVDGDLEFDIDYIPIESGILDEELNIDKFLDKLHLDNEEVDQVKLDWERFFANEDLEDDDEINDEFEEVEDDEFEDEHEELEFCNEENSSKKKLSKEKSFSLIVDFGDNQIKDDDINGLTRVEFKRAHLLGSKDIKVDVVISIEIDNNKRGSNDDNCWQEISLLTQGNYSLNKSGVKIEEIVSYHIEPEVRDVSVVNGELNINGFLNLQIAFYHKDNEGDLSLLNLRKPISISNINNCNILNNRNYYDDNYKLDINNSHVFIKDEDTICYEAEVYLWLQEMEEALLNDEALFNEAEVYDDKLNIDLMDNISLDNDIENLEEYDIDLNDENSIFDDLLEDDLNSNNHILNELDIEFVNEKDVEESNIEIEELGTEEDIVIGENETDSEIALNFEDSISQGEEININVEELDLQFSKLSDIKSKLKTNIKKITKGKIDSFPQISNKAYTVALYLIKEGDTLNSIAEKFYVSPEEIQDFNKITAKDIYPNNSIFIKKRG